METILRFINLLLSVIILGLTIWMVITYRKPKRFRAGYLLFSMAVSFVILLIYLLISGARLNWIITAGLFIVGGVIGVIRGFMVKLYFANDQVLGRNSMLALIAWGISLVLSSLMNSLGSVLLASVGLIPLCFSTGIQVGLNFTLLIRRMLLRPGQSISLNMG